MSDTSVFTPKPEIQGYKQVRRAAKNYRAYSSDLTGDADIRTYRHLPTEADPPRHTQLRTALMPLFAPDVLAPRVPAFTELARDLIADLAERGSADVVSDFVMPYVMGCLGMIFNRRQDVEEWISWGPDVWKPHDIWEFLVDIEPGGEKLNHDDLLGSGSVLLAGGRNTVIKLISGFIWHFINSPEDREFLAANPDSRSAAIAEMARYLSPLPKIECLEVDPEHPDGEKRLVLLSYLSANFDDTEFADPEKLDIHREEKPNLAFGFSRHSCLGLQITRHETVAFLDAVLSEWPGWRFDGEPVIAWEYEQLGDRTVKIIDAFVAIPVVTG